MKALVAYISKTGSTKKIAEAIFQGIEVEKEIKKIDDVAGLEDFDIAFLGFPVHQMGPDKKSAEFLKKHCIRGRNIVLFITHAAQENSPDVPLMLDKFREAACGANILDIFDCQGELDKTTKRIMSILPDSRLRRWAKEDNSQGQPDQSRIDRARDFAVNFMKRFPDRNQDNIVKTVAGNRVRAFCR